MNPLALTSVVGALLSLAALLRRRQRSAKTYALSGLSVASWGLLWFATGSPFAALGMSNLLDHMIAHVIVMFSVPMGLIASGTLRSWSWILPVGSRRRLMRWWYVRRRVRVPRLEANAVVAALIMNAVMVSAHLPAVFDAVMSRQWAMDWFLEPVFLLSGLLFFHYLIPAWPRRVHTRLRFQLVMVVVTMIEMLIVAMAMSIFSKGNWYTTMSQPAMPGMPPMPGMGAMGVSAATAFHRQQLAAGLLWICGDFWGVPCLVLIVRRLSKRDGSIFGVLERQSERFSSSGA